MLEVAWRRGRAAGGRKLAEHASPENAAHERSLRRAWGSSLPAECPYSIEDVAGYDPSDKDAEPDADVWPAPVVRVLNEALGADYPVRFRGAEREGGRSR